MCVCVYIQSIIKTLFLYEIKMTISIQLYETELLAFRVEM